MPRDSNGNTTPLPGTIVSLGQTIQPSQHNPMVEDLYAMMTQSLSRDGQGGMRTNLDMGGFRVRNLEAASLPNDAVRKAEFDVTADKADEVDLKLNILQPSVDVASATTTDIGAAASQNVRITGATTITGFGTVAEGTLRFVRMAGSLTLTHNATSLILPGRANIITAANDCFVARSLGSGNWLVSIYQQASTLGSTTLGTEQSASGSAVTFTGIPPGVKKVSVMMSGVSLSTSVDILVRLGTSGGLVTSGYTSSSEVQGGSPSTATNGFVNFLQNTTLLFSGEITFSRVSGDVWVGTGQFVRGGGVVLTAGVVDLGAELTQLQVLPSSTGVLDAGTFNISWSF